MSRQAIEEKFKSQLLQVGKAGMNALFPNDFPFYMISLELTDSQGNSVDYFSWPVLPDEIRESHQEITNIKKTMSAVNILKNPTFNPRQVSIRGDFGRRFKILLGGNSVTFAGFNLSIKSGKIKLQKPGKITEVVPEFSSFAKTGYGCIKVLEAIKEKSKGLDDYGQPFSLYLYNPILGNNYQVEFNSFSHMQDKDKYNMIPAYSIMLTAVAPLSALLSREANLKSAGKNLSLGTLQKTANGVASNLKLIPSLGKR